MIQKLIINKVISLLAKNFKLFKILEYVEKPNELDHKVVELEKEIKKLKKESHPPVFSTEERDTINTRIKSHSDRLILIEKKIKKIK